MVVGVGGGRWGSLKFRFLQFEGNPAVAAWHHAAKGSRTLRSSRGVSAPPQLGEGEGRVWCLSLVGGAEGARGLPSSHRFLTALISVLVGAGRRQTCGSSSRLCSGSVFGLEAPPWPAFSEAGSWRRGLSAASASAAGGAAPAPTGRVASWSWTRWTVGGGRGHGGGGSVRPADFRGTRAVGFFSRLTYFPDYKSHFFFS